MEIIAANLDLILTVLIIIAAAVIFARRGQIDLLRELILGLVEGTDKSELYERLPKLTRLMVSDMTFKSLLSAAESSGDGSADKSE